MSWAIGYDANWGHDIGYGVPAVCDHPKCNEEIDRGLAHVCCDQKPCGGEKGCGLYFCGKHQDYMGRCPKCARYDKTPYKAKPDVREWIEWKLTHESWQRWRDENPDQVEAMKLLNPSGGKPSS